MWVRARSCWLPKAGNTREEYEDAYWPESADREARVFRAAVGDGATETSFSGLWAQLLTRAYARGRLSARHWERSLATLQQVWQSEVGREPLPWYAEEKVRQGAFSSLVGLTLAHGRDGVARWHAIGVGDSCLFQMRGGALLAAFPLATVAEFGSRPYLLSSNPARNGELSEHLLGAEGEARPCDTFHLLTDALASWFLAESEAGRCPWNELEAGTEDPETFGIWLSSLRAGGSLRNDDVTALTIHIYSLEAADGVAHPARL